MAIEYAKSHINYVWKDIVIICTIDVCRAECKQPKWSANSKWNEQKKKDRKNKQMKTTTKTH